MFGIAVFSSVLNVPLFIKSHKPGKRTNAYENARFIGALERSENAYRHRRSPTQLAPNLCSYLDDQMQARYRVR